MNKTPHHLGIIMDGNRRWAKEKSLPVFEGHRRGVDVLTKIVRHCIKRNIKVLTLFAFSTENWQRSKKEITLLMGLVQKGLKQNFKKLADEGIKLRIIGQREKLPKTLQASLKEAEEMTQNNQVMILNIALSYGGRAEITEAIKNIVKKKIPLEKINEGVISQNLWTSDLDLLIRTGKEQRLSNFLIWQAAYSELYFCEKYWPDFNEKDLDNALADFSQRQRRQGR
ncbi:di-trans,poly-cis-decaprenylcistransferase [Candidatus Shapirobacteria bacterium CG10_big_fil_rev_8_21_14_0_10_38_14]|uniref:Isoprenyl transferase n=1 Tax=Candidatus Shapirobacteria bacterium CG10_big_fil_rev_8_21_14_0_10_38_14 TaxID=1974483 RepID=A0A2M8L5I8_9BACT|nr:MAG: di-trans,poly-cis-decaprenylcistransferase [Candidatus Shapirobacteria bacterium CG10_big_fil_rev_8_21_14_0_10_38_14]